MILSIMTLSITALNVRTFIIMAFYMTALSIITIGSVANKSIKPGVSMLSVVMLNGIFAECHSAKSDALNAFYNAECHTSALLGLI